MPNWGNLHHDTVFSRHRMKGQELLDFLNGEDLKNPDVVLESPPIEHTHKDKIHEQRDTDSPESSGDAGP